MDSSTITYFLIGLMTALFLFTSDIPDTGIQPLDYVLRSFYHGNPYHLLANMYTFIQLSSLATTMPPTEWLTLLLFLLVTSSLILFLIHTTLPTTKRPTIGFSAVLFGLLVLVQRFTGDSLLSISKDNILEILPQFFVPGISFWGHLSGIISGLIYLLINGK